MLTPQSHIYEVAHLNKRIHSLPPSLLSPPTRISHCPPFRPASAAIAWPAPHPLRSHCCYGDLRAAPASAPCSRSGGRGEKEREREEERYNVSNVTKHLGAHACTHTYTRRSHVRTYHGSNILRSQWVAWELPLPAVLCGHSCALLMRKYMA